ncbi:UDP-N-acetylmuramoyl-tripeptide--D-alanyl-D-alanine ligase [Fervidicella metallireducens AeB]|uniref:UDP-N-acetylmuramoyl-tripeptide--D-alanyl-D-alanine ligase n=1 Tax=Fervidicella metallireducens AeB TaxID=1403537 RepID=A0A017RUP5_9CLOT|nr:UDP-N-acetylmuramoyl-tripeptide--D-alanyl-D-alanine ligase [Fervidicella metallireducens]EYE88407.1 UDP-N-acetylmuramoyl-tripeptide--D-alanyl-D-alanine ligase [Fervidicella metallireducens AeB]
MIAMHFQEIVQCLEHCTCDFKEDFLIKGISTDSRNIKDGDLFIALIGQKFDGHEFVQSCYERGAAAVLVSKKVDVDCPQIIVNDTLAALREIARYYRDKFKTPIIAVTGSTGKTSTKEMIASVLKEKFNVHKTKQNFNNEIGLPLTLFELEKEHEISVLEMGMNNLGEIERLAYIARPTIGVITNIGTAHIENLGSRENIMKAKMEITSFFDNKNTLIVNGDDEYLSTLENLPFKLIKVSTKGRGDYNAVDIVNLGENGVEFKCNYKGKIHDFRIIVPGIHNVYNALVAIAIADIYNLTVDEVINGIINFKPGKLRMDIINLENGIKIINDCYNANLDSMKAALDVLGDYKNNRRIAVLGDMFELGSFSEKAHKEVGSYAKDKCDLLIAVGNDARFIFEESNKSITSIYFKTKEEACRFLNTEIKDKDVILIKASRGMKMEYITNCITEGRKRGI